jgi:hypothetical protein
MRKNDTLSPTAAPRRRSGHGDRRTSNFFFAGITPAAAQGFRIGAGKWNGALEGLVDFASVETTSGSGARTTNENLRTEQRLTLRNPRVYLFHPEVVSLSLGGTFGLFQEDPKFSQNGSSFDNSSDGTLWSYDVLANVLPGKRYSLDLFANRSQFSQTRELAGNTDVDLENYGVALHAKYLYIPSILRFRQESIEEESRTADIFTLRDENRNILSYEGRRGWLNKELILDYEFLDKNDEVTPELSYESHEVNVYTSVEFGPELNRRWDSRLRFSTRSDFSPEDRIDVEQPFNVDHSEQLSSLSRYQLIHTSRPAGDTTSQTGSASLVHQLYSNLRTELRLATQLESAPDRKRDSYEGNLDLDYTKRLPGNGRLNVGLGGSLRYDDDEFPSFQTSVFQEPHTFGHPALAEPLDNPFVITSSIVVTKVANGPGVPPFGCPDPPLAVPRTLAEGVDYDLLTTGDITEIVPISCAIAASGVGINPGDTIEVDYRFAVPGDLAFTTGTWRVDASLDYNWIRPFFRHEGQNQDLSSGEEQAAAFLNDRRRSTVGVELRYDRARLTANVVGQAEYFRDRNQSYETLRANGFAEYDIARGLSFRLRGEIFRRDFSDPEDRVTESLSARASLTYTARANLFSEAFASYRDLEDTLVQDEETTELGMKARWRLGKLTVAPSLRYIERLRGDTDSDDIRATLRVNRGF